METKKTMKRLKKEDIKHLGLTISPYVSSFRQAQYAIDVMDKDYTRALDMNKDDLRGAWNMDNTTQEDKELFEEVVDMLCDKDGKVVAEKMAEAMRAYFNDTDYSLIINMRGRNTHETIYKLVQFKRLFKRLA